MTPAKGNHTIVILAIAVAFGLGFITRNAFRKSHEAFPNVSADSTSLASARPRMEAYNPNDPGHVSRQEFTTENFPRSYELTDFEHAAAQAWIKDHKTAHRPGQGTVFGQYEVRFWNSSIGNFVTLKCSPCGLEKGITDLRKF